MKIFGTAAAQRRNPDVITDLNAAKIAYERDGYLIYDFAFSDELLSQAEQITASIPKSYVRTQDLWRVNASAKSLAISPEVLTLLGGLYERRAFPFQTLNFRVGTQQATHADSLHFSSVPENFMCGVWVALEDIDMENGPLHYFKGSHKRPTATMQDIQRQSGGVVDQFFAQAHKPYEKEYGLIKRGQAVIWAANLLHGGDPIIDQTRTRLSQVTHYFFDDCYYVTPINNISGSAEYIRHPYDISQNKFIWGRRNGKIVRPHIKSFLGGYLKNILRQSASFE